MQLTTAYSLVTLFGKILLIYYSGLSGSYYKELYFKNMRF